MTEATTPIHTKPRPRRRAADQQAAPQRVGIFVAIMLNDAPRFDPSDAARIARDVYGIDATARPLPSERDQNFLLTDGNGTRRVLKIANATERAEMLSAQQAAMTHVARHLALCPRPLPTSNGSTLAAVRGEGNREHSVWAVTHLPGRAL